MGALRKAGVWLGLIEDDDERHYTDHYEDDYTDDDLDEPVSPVRARLADRAAERAAERAAAAERASERLALRDRGSAVDRSAATTDRSTVRPMTRTGASPATAAYPTRDNLALTPPPRTPAQSAPAEERRYQITTLHPTTYSEARTIGEHFRDGVPVIINLTELEEADAKRLVDFAAGLAFGLRGTMERVTNRVFLLSPANVQVTAEDKARIAEGGFFNQG